MFSSINSWDNQYAAYGIDFDVDSGKWALYDQHGLAMLLKRDDRPLIDFVDAAKKYIKQVTGKNIKPEQFTLSDGAKVQISLEAGTEQCRKGMVNGNILSFWQANLGNDFMD